ncbi:MAG: hypothetical protein ACP5E4_04350 [Candidatus Aenigmatarchaeota archaeon]
MAALALTGIFRTLGELTNLKTGIYQPKMQYALEVGLYSSAALLMPLLLFQSQFLLGTVVNAMLISGALYLKGKEMLPLIILPSIGTLAKGVLFGPLTVNLIYMLPFIWMGNAVLIYSIKGLHLKKGFNLPKSAALASIFKSGLLFASAFALFSAGFVPPAFLTAFGIMQFVTAFSAGLILWPVHRWRVNRGRKQNQ